jgi:hypothetical protein
MTIGYEDLLRVIIIQFNPDKLSRADPGVPGMPGRSPLVVAEPTYAKDFRRIRRKSFA